MLDKPLCNGQPKQLIPEFIFSQYMFIIRGHNHVIEIK